MERAKVESFDSRDTGERSELALASCYSQKKSVIMYTHSNAIFLVMRMYVYI